MYTDRYEHLALEPRVRAAHTHVLPQPRAVFLLLRPLRHGPPLVRLSGVRGRRWAFEGMRARRPRHAQMTAHACHSSWLNLGESNRIPFVCLVAEPLCSHRHPKFVCERYSGCARRGVAPHLRLWSLSPASREHGRLQTSTTACARATRDTTQHVLWRHLPAGSAAAAAQQRS